MEDFRAPRWLPGGHAQTIWPALFSRRFGGAPPAFRRERWRTPDADFVDVDWQGEDAAATLLVLFHGLEGSSSSHYAQAFAAEARQRGWRFAVPHFRGCSGELNLAPRAYHSGDWEEVGWMLARFRERHRGPIVAVGVSLGGNALLRFAEEAGATAAASVRAIAAVSAPLDLAAGGRAIGRGFGRQVYTRMFMRTMRAKALAQARAASRPLRCASGCARRATCATSTTSSPRRCTAFAMPPTTTRAPRPGRSWPASAFRRSCSTRATIRSCPPRRCPPQARSARTSRCGSRRTAATSAFPSGRWPGHLQTLPESVAGWLARHG